MIGSLEAGACPACRTPSSRELFAVGAYRLRRCTSCGLRFADPRPDQKALDDFYGASYFDTHGWHGGPEGDSEYLRECWAGIRDHLNERFPKRGRLLDVGCATGTLMIEAARDGWDCVGLEVSEAATERARGAGLDVRQGSLGDKRLEGEIFDVVCSFHVIEHVIDPRADLALMRERVGRGGLAVIETPNAESIGFKVRRAKWVQIRPPEHIQFFDRRSMGRALRSTGWRPLRQWTIYRPDTAARIAKQWSGALVGPARVAARAVEAVGMGGNLRVIAEAV
ncbi:MAG: class I SAM-dependent methyltransferase [Actinomycetota bacterium]|nr:class I SAM-dependent methyltransferase [Actinomycetota bacterium]